VRAYKRTQHTYPTSTLSAPPCARYNIVWGTGTRSYIFIMLCVCTGWRVRHEYPRDRFLFLIFFESFVSVIITIENTVIRPIFFDFFYKIKSKTQVGVRVDMRLADEIPHRKTVPKHFRLHCRVYENVDSTQQQRLNLNRYNVVRFFHSDFLAESMKLIFIPAILVRAWGDHNKSR